MKTVGLGTRKKELPETAALLARIEELEKENAALKKTKSAADKKDKAETTRKKDSEEA